jgi:hypothetical protein
VITRFIPENLFMHPLNRRKFISSGTRAVTGAIFAYSAVFEPFTIAFYFKILPAEYPCHLTGRAGKTLCSNPSP